MSSINDSAALFQDIAKEFGVQAIKDGHVINKFFEVLLEKTNGWVIVDFLDMGSWDRVEKFQYDNESHILTLVWHDYKGIAEEEQEKEVRQTMFPASLYSLAININGIVPVCYKNSTVFLLLDF